MAYKDRFDAKAYDKVWHQVHKEERKLRRQQRQDEVRKWVDKYKASLKCEVCGESHIACLDFHHIDPATKEIQIGRAIQCGWNIQRIQAEINKCKVLCSNCHRKLHYEERHTGVG